MCWLFLYTQVPPCLIVSLLRKQQFRRVSVVQTYYSTDTAKFHFMISENVDVYMINDVFIVVQIIPLGMLTSISVDEIMLLRYVNRSTNFRGLSFNFEAAVQDFTPLRLLLSFEGALSCLKHITFLSVFTVVINPFCGLLGAMQHGFDLGRCICKKHTIIRIICARKNKTIKTNFFFIDLNIHQKYIWRH